MKAIEQIEFKKQPSGLYDPLRYMIGIGGKRIRPKLCLLVYSCLTGCKDLDSLPEEILEPARALEVFHTFTLIHDDIMDRSPLRRGEQTVWKKWNEDTAILSGDVMLIDAYQRVAKAPEKVRGKILDLFSETAAQVCEGQQYDMDFEDRTDVTMPEYEQMIGLKTGVLIACAAKMGALLAGASDKIADALYEYGYRIGLAFQIADDYLDAYGDEKVFGKPIGGDIVNNKKSWLTISASASPLLAEAMAMPSATPDEASRKIAAVRAIYDSLGVPAAAVAEIARHNALAIEALEPIGNNADAVESLRKFADELSGRAK